MKLTVSDRFQTAPRGPALMLSFPGEHGNTSTVVTMAGSQEPAMVTTVF